MKIFFSLILIFLVIQEKPEVIKLPKFYKGEGVIFTKYQNNSSLSFSEKETAFKPNLNQITRAEEIFIKKYPYYRKMIREQHQLTGKFDVVSDNPSKIKKHFERFNRQYSGYVDSKNDSIIFIGMLNFKDSKNADFHFETWKEKIIFGSGKFYQKNHRFYYINLRTSNFLIK
jgi:hypothetical protein